MVEKLRLAIESLFGGKTERQGETRMTTTTITFIGKGHDKYGMPLPFLSYLLIESEHPQMGDQSYIASIVPLTEPGPMPAQRHFISNQGEGSAMKLAIDALKSQAEMRDLQAQESRSKI